MTEIITLVTQLGFPVAVCLILMYYIKYINDQHRAESDKMREVLENNTLALQRLADKIGGSIDDNDGK